MEKVLVFEFDFLLFFRVLVTEKYRARDVTLMMVGLEEGQVTKVLLLVLVSSCFMRPFVIVLHGLLWLPTLHKQNTQPYPFHSLSKEFS